MPSLPMNDSNLNGNFNRIEGGTPSQLRGGASVEDPNKFYNKKLQMALEKHAIDIEMGYLTNWGKKTPQNSSMEEIEASK